jgi:hypothetical protein
VPGRRDDEEVSGRTVPGRFVADETDPTAEDVQRGLTRALVLVQHLPFEQRDHRLAQLVFVPAVDGAGAASRR